MNEYNQYQSPFSWRYASNEMRKVWSETYKRRLWRNIWIALAQAQSEMGLVKPEQVADLRAHVEDIDVPRALEIESDIHHDLMAEVKAFGEKCPIGRGIIHLGATSMDIEDNADALRLCQSLDIILDRLAELLTIFAAKIEDTAELTIIAFTHLQPAEPSTLGYRLAVYAQDLLVDFEAIRRTRTEIRGKGFKGAVGTGASYAELVGIDRLEAFENRLSELIGIAFFPVTNQTYPRKQDYFVLNGLAGLGATLNKFAFDLRLLQSPAIGEWGEPFGKRQVGSSAMPFKKNPINAEKINSLARLLAQMPVTAWQNAAHSLLERTLDDSANRRTLLPEAFLIADELILTSIKILRGLQVNEKAIIRNLDTYAPFASTERLLMALAVAGADRQEMHERLRSHAMTAWQSFNAGQANPLLSLILQDPVILNYLPPQRVEELMDAHRYVGTAPARARAMSKAIRNALQNR